MKKLYTALENFYGRQRWWSADNQLFSLSEMILIQNTNSGNVDKAMVNLKPYLSDLATVLALPEEKLAELIRPSGYYKIKAKRLRGVYQWLQKQKTTDLLKRSTEDLRTELLTIYGVGHETADVMLLYLFEKPVFVADNYARRLFERLNIASYQDYQKMWQAYQPEISQWTLYEAREFHALIDEHCKQRCQKKPHCKTCPLVADCVFPAKDFSK